VEDIDEVPEHIVEIVFEPRVGHECGQGFEGIFDLLFGAGGLRQGTRVGLVAVRAIAIHLQLVEQMGGWR